MSHCVTTNQVLLEGEGKGSSPIVNLIEESSEIVPTSQWGSVITKRQTVECLHKHDAQRKGATTILIRTVDSNVIVILVGVFQ